MAPNATIKSVVEDGSVWEPHRASYSPGLAFAFSNHAGVSTSVDASPQVSAVIKASRIIAAAAQSQRGNG